MSTGHKQRLKERKTALEEQSEQIAMQITHVRQQVASLPPAKKELLFETLYQQYLHDIRAKKDAQQQ